MALRLARPGRICPGDALVAWVGAGCQPRIGDAVRLPPGGSMAEHLGQEEVPVELIHGGSGVRDHGCRARDGTQQGDLADPLAAPASAQEMSIL